MFIQLSHTFVLLPFTYCDSALCCVCGCVCVNKARRCAPPVSPVLAAGVPGGGAGHDPGRLLRSDPPSLPQQAVAAAALAALLRGGGLRPGPHSPLGLHHRGLLLRAGPGEIGRGALNL